MKTRLTFAEMQTFIDGVVDGTITNGFGYKQFYIDYYTAILYNEHDFGGTEENPKDISEVYDELPNIVDILNIDNGQYNTILEAIDAEIQHRLNLMYKPSNDTDLAFATLIDKVTAIVDKFADVDTTQMSEFINIVMENKDNFSANKLIGAMKSNGLFTAKPKKTNKNSVAGVAETATKIEQIK
jgi:hypothetical protein